MTRRRLAAAAAAFSLIGGCAAPPASAPLAERGAQTIELRTRMHELWHHLVTLDYALLEPPQPDNVRSSLDGLQRVTALIGPQSIPPRHPFFSQQLERFGESLTLARRAADATPADYEPARRVVDGCKRCHDLRGG